MHPQDKAQREATRDEKLYNAIIDAEQEVWNRGAPIRARKYTPSGRTRFTRRLSRWWHAGGEIVDLELEPKHTGDMIVGSYADIEKTADKYGREVIQRERFKILSEPITRSDETVHCRARRIQAQDYAATQHLLLVRALILFAAIQLLVLVYQAACLSRG